TGHGCFTGSRAPSGLVMGYPSLSRAVAAATAGCPSGQRERSVKPSAQPTLVRTQHLPPPAKTAPWLRKHGPAGRFVLVTPCIRVRHYGSIYSSGLRTYGGQRPDGTSGPYNCSLC